MKPELKEEQEFDEGFLEQNAGAIFADDKIFIDRCFKRQFIRLLWKWFEEDYPKDETGT